jgi:hypothetical protein
MSTNELVLQRRKEEAEVANLEEDARQKKIMNDQMQLENEEKELHLMQLRQQLQDDI